MRRSKYNSKRVEWDGQWFDSGRELKRYLLLRQLQTEGHISQLERQPPFPLHYNGTPLCAPPHTRRGRPVKGRQYLYRADFRYVDSEGRTVIEDAKGMRTKEYALKKALVEAAYGITITEV